MTTLEVRAETAKEADFDETPHGWARRWAVELAAARKELEGWHTQGNKIIKRFTDDRELRSKGDTRWNLFTANVQTQRAIMYGQTPRVTVARRHADANDDVARVAAEILERLLNSDIERGSDSYATALSYALSDRLLPGMGNAKVRYSAKFETVEVPAKMGVDPLTGLPIELAPAYIEERKTSEDVDTDYVHWRDQLWGPSRVFHEVPWWAFRAQMTREELVARFGDIGKLAPLNAKRGAHDENTDARRNDPWSRADVWEIWSKAHRRVFWYVEGFDQVLDVKDDPLGLEGFWPFPRPMVANPTTDALVPNPDFAIAQDIYNEIDLVSTRITLLERAVRVAGVYDKKAQGVRNLLTNT
ncbi:MAG TPA: hypothetical protein VEY30_02550, partial [Myxococcaceae bacterium]|nr:hypothetical protein [Myxococcaceae bacterium]